MAPNRFPRRCLLMTIGRTPQVVTETLYSLAAGPAASGGTGFVPTEIRLVTTLEGKRQAELDLLGESGRIRALCRMYGLAAEAITFTPEMIHVVSGPDGEGLDDIRTVSDNEQAANAIVQLVRGLTSDDHCALHVSLAGGRKTMGFYLGYALSLFGRTQDRLSHVLVDADFENSPDFFFPTVETQILRLRDKRTADASQARVTLADIPFVSLRGHLGVELLGDASASYTDIVMRARMDLGREVRPASLRLEFETLTAWCGDTPVKFPPTLFAWYAWMADRVRLGTPSIDQHDVDRAQLMRIIQQLQALATPYLEKKKAPKWSSSAGLDGDQFEQYRSKINRRLQDSLGKGPAQAYRIIREGRRGARFYRLPLEASQVRLLTE